MGYKLFERKGERKGDPEIQVKEKREKRERKGGIWFFGLRNDWDELSPFSKFWDCQKMENIPCHNYYDTIIIIIPSRS